MTGNANIQPASAEEIEKAIAAAQAKMSRATVVLNYTLLWYCYIDGWYFVLLNGRQTIVAAVHLIIIIIIIVCFQSSKDIKSEELTLILLHW